MASRGIPGATSYETWLPLDGRLSVDPAPGSLTPDVTSIAWAGLTPGRRHPRSGRTRVRVASGGWGRGPVGFGGLKGP
ncbi:hypothetical protein BHE74_00041577 [Ensete ventricosum]|nr:hypothetical protein BHE74_00041577 [Ensete ventricosum]